MTETEFKASGTALLTKVRQVLQSVYGDTPFTRIRMRYEGEWPNRLEGLEEKEPDYSPCLRFLADRYEKTEEYKRLEGELLSNPQIARSVNCMIGCGGGLLRYTSSDLIRTILEVLLKATGKELDHRLHENFAQLTDFYNSPTVTISGVVWLENLDMPQQAVAFALDIHARGLAPAEVMDLLNSSPRFAARYGDIARGIFPRPQRLSQIEFSYTEPRLCVAFDKMGEYQHPTPQEPDVVRRVRLVIDALRLLLLNGLSTSEMVLCQRFTPFDCSRPRILLTHTPYVMRPTATLSEAEIAEAKRLYEKLSGRALSDQGRIALARLQDFDTRRTRQDRVIDLFIALEAIILGALDKQSDIQGELRFRLALLSAKYVTQDPGEQRRIYALIRNGYTWRSVFVHGSKTPKKGKLPDLNELLPRLSDVCRRIVRKWVTEGTKGAKSSLEDVLFPHNG